MYLFITIQTWNKQMEINTCKILSFSRTHAWKMTLFMDFTNSHLPLKILVFFREIGYKHGIRFGREWGWGWGWVGVDGWLRVGTRTSETKKYFCYKMVRYGIWYWCIVGFVNKVIFVVTWGNTNYIIDVIKRKHFCGTGPLRGESTGHRWIPLSKASDVELWCFLRSAPKQTVEQSIETPVIWDTIVLNMTSLQCEIHRKIMLRLVIFLETNEWVINGLISGTFD